MQEAHRPVDKFAVTAQIVRNKEVIWFAIFLIRTAKT
jgi:hypothetical protein